MCGVTWGHISLELGDSDPGFLMAATTEQFMRSFKEQIWGTSLADQCLRL